MVKHYDNLIYSKIVDKNDFKFKNPKFGKSNTDQSYYEPMASMVQNLSKSASLSSSLHNDAENSIAKIRAESDFLPQNLTQEEMQAYITIQKEEVSSAIKSVKDKVHEIKLQAQQDFDQQQVLQKSVDDD